MPNQKIFEADKTNKLIRINFDLLDNEIEIPEDFITFSIRKRRTYVGIIDQIVDALNETYDSVQHKIIIPMISIASKIHEEEDYTETDFLHDLNTLLINDDLIEAISNHVEETYEVDLNDNIKKSNNLNEQLLYKDSHAKVILKASRLIKITAPVFCEFIEVYDIKNDNDFIFNLVKTYFEHFSSDMNIPNKLYKLAYSRVAKTQYSDKMYWSYIASRAIDINTTSKRFYKRLMRNILIKLEQNRSIVSFIHVVLKNYMKYELLTNYDIHYDSKNLKQTDKDGLSEFDKLEVKLLRRDEGKVIINRLTVNSSIIALCRQYDYDISEPEFRYYLDNVRVNKVQNNLMQMFYADKFGCYNTLFSSSGKEYIMLLIIFKKWLKDNNFPILSKLVVGQPDMNFKPDRISKRKFMEKLIESEKFKELHENQYRFITQNLLDSNVIVSLLSTLTSNTFIELPDYEKLSHLENLDDLDFNNTINEKIGSVAQELINFIEII